MSDERGQFEAALKQDRYDTVTRLIYADWLEERGEDDYAAEQRRMATPEWCEAARGLEEIASQCGKTCVNYDEVWQEHRKIYQEARDRGIPWQEIDYSSAPEEVWVPITFEDLLRIGKEYLDSEGQDYFVQQGSETARDLMSNKDTRERFWECWQIVTGAQVPEKHREDAPFSCTC